MVGIIPIQGGPKNDGFPWPNALTPLYKNYTALHRSVLECAMAGCSSIWVIVEKRYIPLMKAVVGSYIEDPVLAQLPVEYKRGFKVQIPIWYVPVPVKDLGRRDCYGRTILAGAEYAYSIAAKFSNKAKPEKFYVAFPETVYSPWKLQKVRKKIKSSKQNFIFTNESKFIKDGVKTGFTMFYDDLLRYKADFKTRDQGTWVGTSIHDMVRRPKEERNLATKLTLDEVFRTATLDGANSLELPIIHDISDWFGYTKYISAKRYYKMPRKVKYFKFNKMKDLEARLIDSGVDFEDDTAE